MINNYHCLENGERLESRSKVTNNTNKAHFIRLTGLYTEEKMTPRIYL